MMLDQDRRSLLLSALREAARTDILPRFRALGASQIQAKSGPADLVTVADRDAEARITAILNRDWPEALVVGEEAVSADPSLLDRLDRAEWAVILDPVDGTWNFANGLSLFGMIAAVLFRGTVVWGALYDPLNDDWVEASDHGAEMVRGNGSRSPLAASKMTEPEQLNGYVPLGLFPKQIQRRIAPLFPDYGRVTSLRCSCHEYRLMAQGRADFCLSGPTPNVWDHAAGALAVTRAGGVVRFLDGGGYDPLRRRGVLLAAGSEGLWSDLAAKFSFLAVAD